MKFFQAGCAALLMAALIFTACAPADLDPIMGRTDGTPRTAPQRIDCNLIFPAPASDTLAP